MAKKSKGRRLVTYAGKVVTVAQATACVAKGFKGCTKGETAAVVEVVRRMGEAAMRKR